jgi:hypothetical protein
MVTVRAVVPNAPPSWDWWRVYYTSGEHSDLAGLASNAPFKLIGIAGNTADLRACALDPVGRQTDLGCATVTVGFDRDRVIDLRIPIGP